jgi:hypothetical protein
MKINIFEYIVMRKMILTSKKPQEIHKIKKTRRPSFVSFPSPNGFLFRIVLTVPATWQCVDHKHVVVPEALRRSSAG